MPIQKFRAIIEVIETKYFEKIFEFDSDDFYDPGEEVPQNMYEDDSCLMDELIEEDFINDVDSWEWNQPAIGSNDGFSIESVDLI